MVTIQPQTLQLQMDRYPSAETGKKGKKTAVVIILICALVLILAGAGGLVYYQYFYNPSDDTELTEEADEKTETQDTDGITSDEAEPEAEKTETEKPAEENGPAAVVELPDAKPIVETVRPQESEPAAEAEPEIRVGDLITVGTYEQDDDRSDGEDPIEWQILDIDGDYALVISRYVLECVPYNTKRQNVTWEACTLRRWLNGTFYDKAFSEEEKARIKTSRLENDNNLKSGTKGGNSTSDNVFCLSVSEVMKYYNFNNWYDKDQIGYSQDLLAECTPYTVEGSLWTYTFGGDFRSDANGWNHGEGIAYTDNVIGKSCAAWWLRSPGLHGYEACYVGGHGDAGASCDREVDNGDFGVRPAMWVYIGR